MNVTTPTTPPYSALERQPNWLLRYFRYEHLPPFLQVAAKPFGDLARELDASLPDSSEKTAGLRKLLEAKDCFVRAALPQ